jgi:hypothetical protein
MMDKPRGQRPERKPGSGAPSKGFKGKGKPRGGSDFKRRDGKPAPRGPRRDAQKQTDSRPKFDAPLIPEEILAEDLHISVRAQLKTLSDENQEIVARHLLMVSMLIETDPELAHRHALAASKKAGRIAVVRETLGVTAYTIGDFALALRELLTHRRISGSNDQLPLIVDSERGLGRPARAIEAASGINRSKLEVGVRINLAIALSGARLDLGQTKEALQELEIKELSPNTVFEQSPLLFRSYAELLRELGRDAGEWERWADLAEKALAETDGEVIDLIEELNIPTKKPVKRPQGRPDRKPGNAAR